MENKPKKAHISELVPDDKNANKGSERGDYMIEHSLQEYGFGRSVLLDKNKKVIAGNKTIEQAGQMGLEEVIIVPSDGTKIIAVMRTDLDMDTDPRARELGIIDNRASEVSLTWDPEVLKDLQANNVDLEAMWNADELTALLGDVKEPEAPEEFPEVDENIPTKHKCPSCGYEWSNEGKK